MILVELRLGLNGATFPTADLATGIRAAHEAGFEFYEPRVPELMAADSTRILELLGTLSVSWLPLNALEGVFTEDLPSIERKAETLFLLAERFAVEQIILVPGSVENPADHDEAIDTLSRLKSLADARGIRLLYEMIGFSHHAFPSLREARALVESAEIPLVLDTFHLAVAKTRPEELLDLAPHEIGLVHLSDALVGQRGVDGIRDADRVLPGEGGLDLKEIVASLLGSGYRGPISIEVFHPKYGDMEPPSVARAAHHSARSLLDALEGAPLAHET